MSTWFTSDLHLNHDRDFIWRTRGFDDVQDMNARIVDKIVHTVKPGDNVYFLGDVAMSKDKLDYVMGLFELITSIDVHVTWHFGNHDNPKHATAVKDAFGDMITTYDMRALVPLVEDDRFATSHFPLRGTAHKDGELDEREAHLPFPESTDGRILLHGHTHSDRKLQPGMVHVGWDAWGRLVSLYEIQKLVYN